MSNPFWNPAVPLPDAPEALAEVQRWIGKRMGVTDDTAPVLDFIDAVLAKAEAANPSP